MYATPTPRATAAATTLRTTVVFPLPIGPTISVSRPNGIPPTNTRSSPSIPVANPGPLLEAVTSASRCLSASNADTLY
jgi:hypothetical protein